MRAWYLILPAAIAYLVTSAAIPAADPDTEIVIHSEPGNPRCYTEGAREYIHHSILHYTHLFYLAFKRPLTFLDGACLMDLQCCSNIALL